MSLEQFRGQLRANVAIATLGATLLSGCGTSVDVRQSVERDIATHQQITPRKIEVIDCTFDAVVNPLEHVNEAKQCAKDQENAMVEVVAFGVLEKSIAKQITQQGTNLLNHATQGFVAPEYFVREATPTEEKIAKGSTCTNETSTITWLSSVILATDPDNWLVSVSGRYSCSETSLGIASQDNGRRKIEILKASETTVDQSAKTYAHEILHVFGKIGHNGQIQTQPGGEPLTTEHTYENPIDINELITNTNYFEYGTHDHDVMGSSVSFTEDTIVLNPILGSIVQNPQYFAQVGNSLVINADTENPYAVIEQTGAQDGALFRVPLSKPIELIDAEVAHNNNGLRSSRMMDSLVVKPSTGGTLQVGLLDESNNYAALGAVDLIANGSVTFAQHNKTMTISLSSAGVYTCVVAEK